MSNNESTIFIVLIVLCMLGLSRHYRKAWEKREADRVAARKARLASILIPQPEPSNRVMELHSMNRESQSAMLKRWGNLKPEPQPKPIDPSYTGSNDRRGEPHVS
jgi:hypothetical protein